MTIAPASWLVICTLTAGWQKIFSADAKVGFLSHARVYADALAEGKVMAPAKTVEEMSHIVFNDRINAGLCVLFMAVVISIVIYGVRASLAARAASRPTAKEVPFEPMTAAAS